MRIRNALIATAALGLCTSLANADAFINEIHYDNASTDEGEFIEIVLTGGTAAADVDVYLYNGSDQETYSSTDPGNPGQDLFNLALDFVDHGVLGDGNRYYSITLPTNGLQNGAPDGIALSIGGLLTEFLSYEGTFTGANSVANGFLSTDIGKAESSSTEIGSSIQRLALGSGWRVTNGTNTQGAVNVVPAPGVLALLGVAAVAGGRRRRRD